MPRPPLHPRQLVQAPHGERIRKLEGGLVLPKGGGVQNPVFTARGDGAPLAGGFSTIPVGAAVAPIFWNPLGNGSGYQVAVPVAGHYLLVVESIGLYGSSAPSPKASVYAAVNGPGAGNNVRLPFVAMAVPNLAVLSSVCTGSIVLLGLGAGVLVGVGIDNQEGIAVQSGNTQNFASLLLLQAL